VFDVSFIELITIGAVALVVLGPERLPAAARTVGGLLRRARSSWLSVREEFERELAASGVRDSIDTFRDQAGALSRQVEGRADDAKPAEGAAATVGRDRRAPHD
jgi:sec-independent protein translocase protein TatB